MQNPQPLVSLCSFLLLHYVSAYLPHPSTLHHHPNPSPLNSRFMLYKDLTNHLNNHEIKSNPTNNFNHQPQYPIDPHRHFPPLPPSPIPQPLKADIEYEYPVNQGNEINDQQPLPSIHPLPASSQKERISSGRNHKSDSQNGNNGEKPVLEPEPPSVFDREYARIEVDSNKEIRKQEQDEEKKDEFDEDDGDDWDSEDWDDFDEGPIADREKKELEKEKWQVVRGRDHVEADVGKQPVGRKKSKRRRKNRPTGYGDRIMSKDKMKNRESEPEDERQYVRSSRNKASSERHKHRQKADDPVMKSYRESFYRKENRKRKKPVKRKKPLRQQRLKPKSSDRRKNRRVKQKGRRRRKKKRPKLVPIEDYESDEEEGGEDLAPVRQHLPSSRNKIKKKRRKHKPKTYSKNYVYIKKKPPSPSKKKEGIDDYDVAYARGNYQAFVDEYDSDRDGEDPANVQSDESAIVYHLWRG